MKRIIVLLSIVLIITSCKKTKSSSINYTLEDLSKNTAITNDFYQAIIDNNDIASLNQFMTAMPKGGDLHHHYSGSVYAETYLDWVKLKEWSIDSCSLKISTTSPSTNIKSSSEDKPCKLLSVDELKKDNNLYRKLLQLWSDKDFGNHNHNQPAPDENFFNTFSYFGTVAHEYTKLGLKVIKERAIKENVSYIETMLAIINVKSLELYNVYDSTKNDSIKNALNHQLRAAQNQIEVDAILDKLDSSFLKNDSILKKVAQFNNKLQEYHSEIDTVGFKMRYQTYAARVISPLDVYTSLLSGFYAAHSQKGDLLVGVNLVAPENNHTALQDYTLQMRMFNHLHRKYPKVHKALHAGELTLGMVRPKNLLFHINEAISIAKAERIGHGVDIAYETNSYELLDKIKEQSTAIEINLTSNQFILGVQGNEHPYLIYSKNNVPLVIATDDSGVSRNNLTNEYVLLASRYKPSYKKIKEYVYNSINYSFLSDTDKKESLQTLDDKFIEFEEKIASLFTKNK